MKPVQLDSIRRVLVIKWSALGDVVIASALMEDIARALPHAEIHLNTQPNCTGLFAQDPRGSVTGTVTDSLDAVIPGVRVRATNAETGVSAAANSTSGLPQELVATSYETRIRSYLTFS